MNNQFTVIKKGEVVEFDGVKLIPFQKFYLDSAAIEYRYTKKSGPHIVWFKDQGETYSHHFYINEGENEIGPFFNYQSKKEVSLKNDRNRLRSLLRKYGVDLANLTELNSDSEAKLEVKVIPGLYKTWIITGRKFKILMAKMIHPDGQVRLHVSKLVTWPGANVEAVSQELEELYAS